MHTIDDKDRLIKRVRRIRGQLEAVERALLEERDCSDVLQTAAAARGALDGLVAEIVEGHIRMHVLDPAEKPTRKQTRAAEALIQVVHSYLR